MVLESLVLILKELGILLLEWRALGKIQGKWEGTQLKAEADMLAHNFLVEHLLKSWPGIPIISEEDGGAHNLRRPDLYWLIDPIDGTASYCGGFDGFVTQVALMQDSKPIMAVVHAPALELTYTASRDEWAECNHEPISTVKFGKRVPVLIDNYPEPRGIARRLYSEIECGGYVESGSIGLKICRIADGTADIFIKDVTVRDWDLAPAGLILERAGGVLITLAGGEVPYEGEFGKVGLIATSSRKLAQEIVDWSRVSIEEKS